MTWNDGTGTPRPISACVSWRLSRAFLFPIALFTAIACLLAAGPLLAADFTVNTGATLSGDIVRANSNTVTIKIENAGPLMIAREDIASVEIEVDDIGAVKGGLADWDDGVYVIKDHSRMLHIDDDGVLIQVDDAASAKRAALGGPRQSSENMPPALAAAQDQGYAFAADQPESTAYMAGLGIATLVKVNLLPRTGIDLNVMTTQGPEENAVLLGSGEAAFALSTLPPDDKPLTDLLPDSVRAVATIWQGTERSTELIARQDVPDDVVYQIVKTIFDNLPFLNRVDERLTRASLDDALPQIDLPLHPGASRYYREIGLLASGSAYGEAPRAPAGSGASTNPSPTDDPDQSSRVQM